MRRGTMIAAIVLIALAGVGIGVGAFNAGHARGLEQQVHTIETTAPDGTEVVRVVDPGPVYGYGGWGHGGHGGFFPFGLFVFPLFVIGMILLVRAFVWRGGGWGPGGRGPGEPRGGPRDEWRSRAEAWHREMHEAGEGETRAGPDAPPAPATPA